MNDFSRRLLLATSLLSATCSASAGQFDCLIEPRQSIDIRPATEGLIARILVQRGDMVRAGQVLVELDARQERAVADIAKFRADMTGAIKSRESRVEYLSQKSTRREKLVKDNFISVQDRDETAAEHRLAEAELVDAREQRALAALEQRRANEQLRSRTIYSPIDGVVVDRLVNPGEMADNREVRKPLLKLADVSMLHVEVLLPVAAYQSVKLGQTVDVLPEQPERTRYRATVKVIDKVFDAASGTYGVRLELPNPGARIPAGVRCQAVFDHITAVVKPGGAARR